MTCVSSAIRLGNVWRLKPPIDSSLMIASRLARRSTSGYGTKHAAPSPTSGPIRYPPMRRLERPACPSECDDTVDAIRDERRAAVAYYEDQIGADPPKLTAYRRAG